MKTKKTDALWVVTGTTSGFMLLCLYFVGVNIVIAILASLLSLLAWNTAIYFVLRGRL